MMAQQATRRFVGRGVARQAFADIRRSTNSPQRCQQTTWEKDGSGHNIVAGRSGDSLGSEDRVSFTCNIPVNDGADRI